MLIRIMKKLKNWVKNKTATISLALANVEKNAFNQKGETLESDVNQVQRHTQGQLADSLINGEITQEVIDLRWRTYKILEETQNISTKIVGFDKSGYAIVETKQKDKKKEIKKVTTDKFDDFPLEMVINNDPITIGVFDAMNNNYIDVESAPVINNDEKETTATHGTVNGETFYSAFKAETPIKIEREFYPKFMIENFTKKINVRVINDEERLLEFYVSKYPDKQIRTTTLFINEIQKGIKNPLSVNFTQFKKVNFVTYKCLGVSDFSYFEYEVLSFDKIVEFNGFYVIKFKTKIITNGEKILEKYRVEELDKKYKNKEKK